jgi:hypothetical protein
MSEIMPQYGWFLFGLIAWIAGYIESRYYPKIRMFHLPFLIYIFFGLPSGIKSRSISYEGFRLQFLGLLLFVMPVIDNLVQINDGYLLVGSVGVASLLAYLMMNKQG